VSGKLAKEIRQTKPFQSREEEALLNLGRTWEFLQKHVADLMKEHGLTTTQYNMLRILRGAGPDGVTCSQATERMLSPDPDITRLLDRMETQGLIRRDRTPEDRRIVIARITDRGLELANHIDGPLHQLLQQCLGRVGRQRLKDLIDTLEALREPLA
jgi:DNA-binding MarR family transcriptional regulator